MTIKRYGYGHILQPLGTELGALRIPAIVEKPDGEYVLFSDCQRLLAACAAHNELLLGRLRLAERARGAKEQS